MDIQGQVTVQGVARLVAILASFADNDAALRALQAENAPQCKALRNVAVASSAAVSITEAQSGAQRFSTLVVMFDELSGKGRYTLMNGVSPLADGSFGLPIASGGGTITITGAENIKNFRMIAETGNTLNAAYAAFI